MDCSQFVTHKNLLGIFPCHLWHFRHLSVYFTILLVLLHFSQKGKLIRCFSMLMDPTLLAKVRLWTSGGARYPAGHPDFPWGTPALAAAWPRRGRRLHSCRATLGGGRPWPESHGPLLWVHHGVPHPDSPKIIHPQFIHWKLEVGVHRGGYLGGMSIPPVGVPYEGFFF